jgi:hypothetical protein
MLFGFQDVDARDKHGHEESITKGRWYEAIARAAMTMPATSSWTRFNETCCDHSGFSYSTAIAG